MNSTECRKRAEQVLMHTYGRYPIVLDRGDGVYLYDTDGKKYLDFSAGIGVFALGYNNKEYNDALKAQIDKLLHTSNYYYNEPATLAAEAFVKASGMDRVFFTNSGTEAVEGAMKLARKYYYKKTGRADSEIIAMEHSFHGRTMGSVSVTGTKKYREPFEPLIGGVVFAEFNNLADVASKINGRTAAILMETLQGEGGIHPASKEFIEGIAALCREKDIVLILDEIQCGMGRTGSMFCYQQYGVTPDIVTSAKALGCGVPVGAFAATEKVAAAFEPGDHGTTYGGNPFVTAAATKVFELFDRWNVLESVKENGAYLYERLEEFAKANPSVKEHRGIGFMQGLEFDRPVKDIVAKALEQGLILIAAGANTVRFLPPLIMQKAQIDEMMEILKKCV